MVRASRLSMARWFSGIAAKNENGTNTVNITVTMVTGKTATTTVTTKTAIKISRRSSEPGDGKPPERLRFVATDPTIHAADALIRAGDVTPSSRRASVHFVGIAKHDEANALTISSKRV